MAREIKLKKGQEFTFKQPSGAGGETKYPWQDWFSGKLLLLERSTFNQDGSVLEKRDFEVETNHMPPKIKTAARRHYKAVEISRRDADGNRLEDALIIRARDMTDDERAAEDLLRAEEKEELVARRNAKKTAEANGAAAQPTSAASPQVSS